ncbi:DUF2281 domain-containing protein [Chroococcidiopsis sp. FACHB-1243]|uniref:DUF2281 domain-containing protein n=1 Tax=Chroococcidiopsis sp. [FACHB-1243] TaxID=2692781 RepID=UPI00177FFD1B|nr:DUF2281 domain-containing protein [Chroococcidiopsis sp. [FACHB-1243]]MBD2306605.1 DUF2281 domain-containing protein [Chroococcidiopsis sp. [FACHB-1243]]
MNTKEQILQEIDSLSETQLQTLLAMIHSMKPKPEVTTQSQAVQGFLASLEERHEVYRRLADS